MPAIDALLPNLTQTHFPSVNTFTIIGYTMPGKWTLESADKQFGWQIQQAYAFSGAVVFPKGDELVVPKFRGQLWADSQAISFREIRKRLLVKPTYKGGSSPIIQALGIDHPELKVLGVTAVVVGKISPLIDKGGGLWETSIEFIQYRPPKAVDPPPSQVIPDATRTPIEAANAALEIQLDLKSRTLAAMQGKPPT